MRPYSQFEPNRLKFEETIGKKRIFFLINFELSPLSPWSDSFRIFRGTMYPLSCICVFFFVKIGPAVRPVALVEENGRKSIIIIKIISAITRRASSKLEALKKENFQNGPRALTL